MEDDILNLIKIDEVFDVVRLVDPIIHKVIKIRDDKISIESGTCYDVWKAGKVCSNCISRKAFLSQKTCTKIEYINNQVFITMAIPIKLRSKSFILELQQEISSSTIYIDNITDNDGHKSTVKDDDYLAIITDALTGIYNKRYIMERLPEDIMYHSLHNYPLSILMLDLDHFKNVNDGYGHIAGDFILCEIAKILDETVRESKDWVSRFGGEEFLVCLPNTDKPAALNIAERIRSTIENKTFYYEGFTINITVSIGVYTMHDKEICDFKSLICYADHKLYEAKQSGRNKVVG